MSVQPKVSEIIDENSAQTYLDQMVMTAFCRVLDMSRLRPTQVMQMMAAALGRTYREVAAAHIEGQCPCGWCPQPETDIELLLASLGKAAVPQRRKGLASMLIAGRA